jgi:hypothetical protein
MSLRILGAGLFILIGVLGEAYFVDRMFPHINPFDFKIFVPWMVVLVAAAYFLFQDRSPWVRKGGVLTYRRRDELVPDIYHARRALELRDLDTNDGWYLIELDSGKVLCLWDNLPSGPLGFDPGSPGVRKFPCTEFTVLRHAVEGFTAAVICAGEVIKPVTVPLPDHYDDWLYTSLPKDGDIIPGKSFDEVKAEVDKFTSDSSGSETS